MTCLITAHLDWISDVIRRKHHGVNPSTEAFHSEQQCLFMLSIVEATISPRERSQKVRASAAHTTYTVCHSKSLPVFIAGHGRRDLNWSSPMKGQLLGERLLWASRTSAVGLCWQMRRLAWEQSGGHPAGPLQTSTCWRSSRGPNRTNSTHHAERRVKATACRVGLQRSFAVRLKTSQVQLSCQQLSWNRHPSRRAGDPTPF